MVLVASQNMEKSGLKIRCNSKMQTIFYLCKSYSYSENLASPFS